MVLCGSAERLPCFAPFINLKGCFARISLINLWLFDLKSKLFQISSILVERLVIRNFVLYLIFGQKAQKEIIWNK